AESYFLQAEARQRFFGGAGVKALYDAGVTEAFAAVGEDASSFIAPGGAYEWGNEIEGSATLTAIPQIIRQKWAAAVFGGHGIEAWFDKNRTGFPATSSVYSTSGSYIPGQLVIAKNSVLPAGQLPKRFVYPYDETSRNSNAPKTIVPSTTPVWWGL
ncbi:MAG TPA: SusD/RagB family nutrient-binding outer membrane lipoprotein, partial [Puia sp.]|nr:SusD/RagB family nutrient-binding outer membrane lipoprotein [Puia sp.]